MSTSTVSQWTSDTAVLTRRNLWVKRPGTGSIPAERYDDLLGRVAARDLPADMHITMDDVV